jgi:hypothetical protein
VVLWAAAAGWVVGLWPARRIAREARLVGWLLAAFAGWTLLSAAWAPSAERAVAEFDRVVLYLGLFVLVSVAATVVERVRILDGVALGIVAVGLLSLASRFFPRVVSSADAQTLLPAAHTRLNYPLGYWNGLGILLALAFPLLLRLGCARGATAAALAVGVVPALSAAIYLTASRGGAGAAAVGAGAFVVLVGRRIQALAVALVAAGGSAVAVGALHAHRALVDPPLGHSAPGTQGRDAALVLLAVCAATGLVAAALRLAGLDRVTLGRNAGRALALALVAAAVVALVAAHPLRRAHAFAQAPSSGNDDFVQSHLLSSSGSGRWQFWTAAADAFRTQPLRGRGAGSYETWWAQHGSLSDFVRNAHSLYLEVLAELGIVGLILLGGALVVGLGAGARRIRARPAERELQAALVAALLAFALAAAVDWIWQLAAVGAIGIAFLALVLADGEARPRRSPSWTRVAVGAAALVLVAAQAVPLLAGLRLDRSQAAVRRGDTQAALTAALDARDIEPWAASPYLQLALVTEQAGEPAVAHAWIERALARDATDWRLWLVKARLETRLGHVRAAAASLARATALDPRSPLFRG